MTEPKRRRGRPSLGHTHELRIYASPVLARAVADAAKRDGVSVGEWMRRAALVLMAAHQEVQRGK